MYWKPSQYPELKGRSDIERRRVLIGAMSTHGRMLPRRLFVAAGLLLGAAVADGALMPGVPRSDWRWWILPIAAAAMFYAYLLWEVNRPLHRAVAKHLADQPERADAP